MVKRDTFRIHRSVVLLFLVILAAPLLLGQGTQTGSISGRVTMPDGTALPGVTVEARSPGLPQPRVTTTGSDGEYRFPQLPPGNYTVQFALSGMESRTRNLKVFLAQNAVADVEMGMTSVSEAITVTAESSLIDTSSAEIKSAVSSDVIDALPVGQEYRDIVKLTPSLQYSEDAVRGPSSGGNGQDNVYNFDGVNVSLPQYGTLSIQPSTADIQQVAVIKGGATARDFNRAGGFTIDTLSKSGTNEFHGEVSYKLQPDSLVADEKTLGQTFNEDKDWGSASIGGPVLRDRLFFYGSYYRPTTDRYDRVTLYGDAPDTKTDRDEFFGKVTFTPLNNVLLNGSYRNADTTSEGELGGSTFARSTTNGSDSKLEIFNFEASWIVNDRSYASLKYTDFTNDTNGSPDLLLGFVGSTNPASHLDVNNLDQMGGFNVPAPITGTTPAIIAYNAFIAPLIQRYGYTQNGVKVGGGRVGAGTQFDDNDFFRNAGQVGYDITLGSSITNDLHIGYQRSEDKEFLARSSNGWAQIDVIGGRTSFNGQPIMYQAEFLRNQAFGGAPVPAIESSLESQSIELNDTIRMANWTFNVGVLASQDTLYGQGLQEDPSTISGYVISPGTRYEQYKIDWDQMIQPRVGATWAYNGSDNVYANYARYNPAVNSLPRAASWDRNVSSTTYRVYFDAAGNVIGSEPRSATAGKLFSEDMDPRFVDEYILGTSQQLTSRWTGRVYGRYRYAANFWEDTQNNARLLANAPADIPRELYIDNLPAKLAQIGTGGTNSAYVIAELDGAFTKYYEASMESEWRGDKMFVRGSYTWSHYYGNFDQDNTTLANDANSFIGSSNLADGAGRQVWDNKYGDLRGDRRHIFKVYGTYALPWRASAGAFAVYQSGQPWETWSYLPYNPSLTTSTSSSNRYGEPAGSRTTDDHYQIDLNYTQNFPLGRYNFQLDIDFFNITDNQTGYNIQPVFNDPTFGQPRSYYDPRRITVGLRFQY